MDENHRRKLNKLFVQKLCSIPNLFNIEMEHKNMTTTFTKLVISFLVSVEKNVHSFVWA